MQRLTKQTFMQAQWRHNPTVLVITWLVFGVVRAAPIYNEDLFKFKLVDSPGGLSSWE
jgi:hypothetical protein